MPAYYRFGSQQIPYAVTWRSLPVVPQKPPLLELGGILPSRSEQQLLVFGALAAGVYFAFIRKDASGQTLFAKLRKR